ncbi:hypothetical protein FKM82_001163 [Ascaphus truei]
MLSQNGTFGPYIWSPCITEGEDKSVEYHRNSIFFKVRLRNIQLCIHTHICVNILYFVIGKPKFPSKKLSTRIKERWFSN